MERIEMCMNRSVFKMKSTKHKTPKGRFGMSMYLCVLFFLSIAYPAYNQTVPVFASLQITPPYSLKLSDYTVAAEDRLLLTLLLTDQSITQQNVRLKILIVGQGNGVMVQTKPGYFPQAISLFTNTPEILSGNELANYFAVNNLDFQGVDMERFSRTGQLPEGLYRIVVEVYDYNRPVLISNKASHSAWLVLNDPPRWNLPMDNSKIIATNPQNIFMNWLPMHTGSPNSAFTTEYELTVVEMWNQNGNPFDAIRTQTPIFKSPDPISQTSFIYGNEATSLIPGKRYAAVVRAIPTNGLDLFKNNGYSTVLSFTFGDECLQVQNLTVTASGMTSGQATWSVRPGNTAFKVQYRPVGSTNWYGGDEEIVIARQTISSLSPGQTYEVAVQALCGTYENPLPTLTNFSLPLQPQGVTSCAPSTIGGITNQTVTTIRVGDIIKVSNQQLRVTQVTSGTNGYNGKGEWQVAWLGNAPLQSGFSNVKVNTDGVAFSGRMWIEGTGVSLKRFAVNTAINLIPGAKEALKQADDLIAQAEDILANYGDALPADIKADLTSGVAQVKSGKAMVLAGNVTEGAQAVANGATKLIAAATKAVNYAKANLPGGGGKKITSNPALAPQRNLVRCQCPNLML